jgi:hypothetical protein
MSDNKQQETVKLLLEKIDKLIKQNEDQKESIDKLIDANLILTKQVEGQAQNVETKYPATFKDYYSLIYHSSLIARDIKQPYSGKVYTTYRVVYRMNEHLMYIFIEIMKTFGYRCAVYNENDDYNVDKYTPVECNKRIVEKRCLFEYCKVYLSFNADLVRIYCSKDIYEKIVLEGLFDASKYLNN